MHLHGWIVWVMKGQITRRVTLATAVNVYKYIYIYRLCVYRLSSFLPQRWSPTSSICIKEEKSFRESYHVPTLAITADRRRPTAQQSLHRVQSLFESALSRGLFLRVILLPFISGNFDCSRRISKRKNLHLSKQFPV